MKRVTIALIVVMIGLGVAACDYPEKYTTMESCVAAGFEWEADREFPTGHCEAD